MMKKTITIIIAILLLTSFVLENKPTDLKEYGFKGEVKSVTTINYNDLEQIDGAWNINEDKVISKWEMTFNKEGNIIEMKEYYPLIDTIWNEVTTKVEFENGLKRKYTKTDLYGQTTEFGTYTWGDDNNYKLTATQKSGIVVNSYSKLNKNLRDISGGHSYIQNDSILFSESYKNKLKQNGEIISSKFYDKLKDEYYTIEYSDKEKDKKGNLIKVALVYKETQLLKRLSVREFEYFE